MKPRARERKHLPPWVQAGSAGPKLPSSAQKTTSIGTIILRLIARFDARNVARRRKPVKRNFDRNCVLLRVPQDSATMPPRLRDVGVDLGVSIIRIRFSGKVLDELAILFIDILDIATVNVHTALL